jgi:hypothetical protein
MASSIESYHYKIGVKLDCLEHIAKELKSINDIAAIERIRINYSDAIASVMASYYRDGKDDLDMFQRILASDNTIEKMDEVMSRLEQNTQAELPSRTFHPEPAENSLDSLARDLELLMGSQPKPLITLDSLVKTYKDHQIDIKIQKIRINKCSVCDSNMTLFPDTSEMRCDAPECGQIITLYGIVFEDSQFYNQQTVCTKSKKYDPNGHLSKWIDKIQAKEDHQFPPEVISAIDGVAVQEYTRDGRLRPMTNMRCETVREWMQRFRYTDCYDHAPLMRKIITSMHGKTIVPPELTPEERQDILIECSLSLREFETVIKNPDLLRRLDKERVRNKFYYPYVLWQIINLRIKDNFKRRKLLECIHLQSDKTLRNNDIVWREICNRRVYEYFTASHK